MSEDFLPAKDKHCFRKRVNRDSFYIINQFVSVVKVYRQIPVLLDPN